MKYRYSKLAFIVISVVVCFFVMLLLYLFGLLIDADYEKFVKVFIICPGFFFAITGLSLGEYSNRYVEIFDSYIMFNSFRFKRIQNVMSSKIIYENIISIKSIKLPIVGLVGIKIKAKSLPHDIKLSIFFKNHKQMFRDVCYSVNENNKKTVIDSYLKNYFEI